ncbi:hypothetical protein Golob_011955 [Gossypium lobatum]|uniref:RNase H type-1 domain-containing protein n=1 Tax=Gossypium lobatum TaxID=34289 RepID=A0A7J8MRB0_9ROSI|nr:hypothetical protein [Gossypium lobatum]
MAFKDRLLTNKKCVRRGLGDNSAYGICGHNIEDAIHTIRDCNWIYMYTDGAVKADLGITTAGGVMRDWNGK